MCVRWGGGLWSSVRYPASTLGTESGTWNYMGVLYAALNPLPSIPAADARLPALWQKGRPPHSKRTFGDTTMPSSLLRRALQYSGGMLTTFQCVQQLLQKSKLPLELPEVAELHGHSERWRSAVRQRVPDAFVGQAPSEWRCILRVVGAVGGLRVDWRDHHLVIDVQLSHQFRI